MLPRLPILIRSLFSKTFGATIASWSIALTSYAPLYRSLFDLDVSSFGPMSNKAIPTFRPLLDLSLAITLFFRLLECGSTYRFYRFRTLNTIFSKGMPFCCPEPYLLKSDSFLPWLRSDAPFADPLIISLGSRALLAEEFRVPTWNLGVRSCFCSSN